MSPSGLIRRRETHWLRGLGIIGVLLGGMIGVIPQAPALPPAGTGDPTRAGDSQTASAAKPVDDQQVRMLAEALDRAAMMVRANLYRHVEEKVLIAGAIRQWYQAIDAPLPERIVQQLERLPNTPRDRVHLLMEIRRQLRDHPRLWGTQSLLLGLQGFTQATEGHCSVTWRRSGVMQAFSVELDFGVGLELEGWTGSRWTAYQWERALALRRYPPVGYIGDVPAPEQLSAPVYYPWRIRRVIPGSPAHFAGVRKGDVITHYRGTALTPENAHRLFQEWAYAPITFDPVTGRPMSPTCHLTIQRGREQIELQIAAQEQYQAECVYGVRRHGDGGWDWWLDRPQRIGYIRLGPLELHAPVQLRAALEELQQQRCQSLILDLRWCPGGYVQSAIEIASLFLPANTLLARLEYPNGRVGPPASAEPRELRTLPQPPLCPQLPLVVLIGPETLGGGEMIAAALRDHNRCWLAGQRSAGRGALQTLIGLDVAELQLRVSTGLMLRPNGQPRHRFPNSQPTDAWGLRPDPGWEIPLEAAARQELFRQLESFTLRLPSSREASPLDDPRGDSVRYTALQLLRKHLEKLSSPAPSSSGP